MVLQTPSKIRLLATDAYTLFQQSISLGLVSDVGMAGAREDLQRSIKRDEIYGNTVAEIVQLGELVFTSGHADGGVTQDPLNSGHLLTGLASKHNCGRIAELADEMFRLDISFLELMGRICRWMASWARPIAH
jgi:hypothetical protein